MRITDHHPIKGNKLSSILCELVPQLWVPSPSPGRPDPGMQNEHNWWHWEHTCLHFRCVSFRLVWVFV